MAQRPSVLNPKDMGQMARLSRSFPKGLQNPAHIFVLITTELIFHTLE